MANFALENLLVGYDDAKQVSGGPELVGANPGQPERVCFAVFVGQEPNARLLIDGHGNLEFSVDGVQDQSLLLTQPFRGMLQLLGDPAGGIELVGRQLGTPVEISDATNANPIVVTAAAHAFADGWNVWITGVEGNTAANGARTIHVIDADHFSLLNIAGSGVYAGGGTARRVSGIEAQPRIAIMNDGSGIRFGDGAAVADVALYRPAAAQLDVEGSLGIVYPGENYPRVAVGNTGGGIVFSDGSMPPDTAFYRSAPGTLVIEGGVLNVIVLGDPNPRAQLKGDAAPGLYLGDGLSAADTSVYRSGAGELRLGAAKIGFFDVAAAARPAVAGSWAGNTAGAALAAALASLGLISDNTTA